MAQYGSGNQLMPTVSWILDVPDWPDDLAKRDHNRFVKAAVRKAMQYHLDKHIPIHFQRRAHSRYHYAQRDPKYIRSKQRRYHTGGMDLVKTGKSRQELPRGAKITVGGSAVGGKRGIVGTLRMRFPFRGGTGRFRKATTRQAIMLAEMIQEMQRVHPQEARDLRILFRTEYFRLLANKQRQRKRKRRHIAA